MLIAVNPNKEINLYSLEAIEMYRNVSLGLLPPHVFAIGRLLKLNTLQEKLVDAELFVIFLIFCHNS